MKTQIIAVLAVSSVMASPAVAQQLNGATASLAYQSIEGDLLTDFDATSFAGGLDFGITPEIAVGGSIESVMSDEFDDDIFIATVRGMYTSSDNTAFGLYYSLDQSGDLETTLYGIEGAYKSGGSAFEAYFGGGESDVFGDNDLLNTAGFSFEFGVGAGISLGLDYQSYKVEDALFVIDTFEIVDANVTDTALTARYSFLEGASVYTKVGRIRAFGDSDEPNTRIEGIDNSEYVTIGAQYDFSGGALFDARSLFSYGG